ncbi:efflux RND transporter periplasmic adaptor subunit [Herbivorax sp. ANBcel31]|uniref:efflux RND transporter periplasmic adaptor subunit n=1 Tax=Herbivorax sp. ANBcel31 TaxID=3069754 RepID=UPI0027B3AF89|nr:efflux RND transporter periplasmic adaptor subunit [Herbivorax sp. ANBcel31]MDQ2085680.1 efflux RND transporter periplasmic adaptor subunit [Herbivorax sp. ANBcel31]
MKEKILVLLTAFILLMAVGCSTSASNDDENNEERPVSVGVDVVKRADIERVQTIVGQAKPLKEINVVPKQPGKVSELYVSLGEQVEKGQTLFKIDDKEIRLQLAQSEASVNVARSNLNMAQGGSLELQMAQLESSLKSAEINLNDAKKAYDDARILYENGMASKQDFERAETGYELAKEQYESAKTAFEVTEARINKENTETAVAQLRQAEAAYDLAKTQLENTVVTSPANGYISALNVSEGEMASNASPSATVVDISTIIVDVNVGENIVNSIKTGDEYLVYIKSVQKEPFLGEVVSVSPNVDQMTQSYLTKIEVPNENKFIKGGMSAEVEIAFESKENVMTVPVESIINESGKSFVYVIDEDRAVRSEVSTGISSDKLIEISGDIKEGDRVIIKGQNFLSDNSRVIVTGNDQETE